MAKQPKGTHFVISAGLTTTGAPVYRRSDGSWTQQLQEAHTATTTEEAESLVAVALREERVVADPYSFPVELVDGKIDPLSARENIRALGPTVPYRRPPLQAR